MTLEPVLGTPGVIGIVMTVVVGVLWFILTVFILCIMEVRLLLLNWICRQGVRDGRSVCL